MLRWVDLPPVWLGLALLLVWVLDQLMPIELFWLVGRWCGVVLVTGGLTIMAAAVVQMLAARTTVIPRSRPARLVTQGIFRVSRNPIYLGDAMILTGAVLYWDVPLAIPLVMGFKVLIERRFILQEEVVLRAAFGAAFETWAARVGRWFGAGNNAAVGMKN